MNIRLVSPLKTFPPESARRNHVRRHWRTDADEFPFAEAERRAHFERSRKAILTTFALVLLLFVLFFGLVAACGWL